jgi:hypothetical protein
VANREVREVVAIELTFLSSFVSALREVLVEDEAARRS